MIETRGLRKAFGDHVVLDGIDLNVAEGTIFALLGPNGAGKTTMVHILSTLIKADGSEARVAEYDLVREPLAVAWCAVLILVGYLWARAVYNRDPVK